jgi:CDGSH-type Zn-finger protein
MSKGHIAGTAPVKVDVEAGKDYWWCACGQSKNQPFCDGSHKGSAFTPVQWKAEKSGSKWFCTCKQTDSRPFCDGSHNRLAG